MEEPMSTTVTIPAELVSHVRGGLYEYLQVTYEALDVIIVSSHREDPKLAPEQQEYLDQFVAAVAALRAAGPASDPSQPVTVSLVEHRPVLLKAIRAAARTEQCLTEELPVETPRRQQARQTIAALRRLARQIKVQDAGPQDLYLERLVVLAVLDRRHSEGRTRAELHDDLDDFPAEYVDDAVMQLAALGLVRPEGQHIEPADGLSRIDELDLIGI
jgi:hypothetical protein